MSKTIWVDKEFNAFGLFKSNFASEPFDKISILLIVFVCVPKWYFAIWQAIIDSLLGDEIIYLRKRYIIFWSNWTNLKFQIPKLL